MCDLLTLLYRRMITTRTNLAISSFCTVQTAQRRDRKHSQVEHILQSCPLYDDLRQAAWTEGEDLQEKLRGPVTHYSFTLEMKLP